LLKIDACFEFDSKFYFGIVNYFKIDSRFDSSIDFRIESEIESQTEFFVKVSFYS